MRNILSCVGISSIFFWGVIVFICIFSAIERKKHPVSYGKVVKDTYGTVCLVCNLISGFLLFALCSAGIALLTENMFIRVILHLLAWYISGVFTERIFPRVNNKIVALFMKIDID